MRAGEKESEELRDGVYVLCGALVKGVDDNEDRIIGGRHGNSAEGSPDQVLACVPHVLAGYTVILIYPWTLIRTRV